MIIFNIEHYISKNNFLYQQLSDTYKTALQNLINIVVDEYLSYTPMFNKYFTDHGPFHSKEITDVVTKLVQINTDIIKNDKPETKCFLNEDECFILLSSIWLHDIGMIYNIDTITGHILYEQVHRAKHAEQSIRLLFEKRKELFIYTLPYSERLIKLISDVCVNHTTDVKKWENKKDEFDCLIKSKIRTRLLIALLRIGDLLDLRQRRAPQSLRGILKVPTISLMHWDVSELIDFYDIENINNNAFVCINGRTLENIDSEKENYKYPLFLYKYVQITNEFTKLRKVFHNYGFNINFEFMFSHDNFDRILDSQSLSQDSLERFHSNNDENILFYIARNYYLRKGIRELFEQIKKPNITKINLIRLQLIDRISNYISNLVKEFHDFQEMHDKDELKKANIENLIWIFDSFFPENNVAAPKEDIKTDNEKLKTGYQIIDELFKNNNSIAPPTSYFRFREELIMYGKRLRNNNISISKLFESFGIDINRKSCSLESKYKPYKNGSIHFNIFKSLEYLENNMYNIHQYNTLLMFLRLGYTKNEHPLIYREINAIISKLTSQLQNEETEDVDKQKDNKKSKQNTDFFQGHVHNKCNLCTGRLLSILCYYLGINSKIKDEEKTNVIKLINLIIKWLQGVDTEKENNFEGGEKQIKKREKWGTIKDDKTKVNSPRYTAAVLNGLIDYIYFFHCKDNNPYYVDSEALNIPHSNNLNKESILNLIFHVYQAINGVSEMSFKKGEVVKEGDDLPIYTHSLNALNNYKRLGAVCKELKIKEARIKIEVPAKNNDNFYSDLLDEIKEIDSGKTSIITIASEWPIVTFKHFIKNYDDIINKIRGNVKAEDIHTYIVDKILKHPVWDYENGSWGSNITETFHLLIHWMMYWEEELRTDETKNKKNGK